MTAISKIKVYATQPHPCSYLKDEVATTLFIDPETVIDKKTYSALSDVGFRRSGKHLYRPHCQYCTACVSTRILVEDFCPKRRHRRIWRKNQDLTVTTRSEIRDHEYYQLYEQYISLRHNDGDMFPTTREQYDSFLTNEWNVTRYHVFSLDDHPVAIAVTDELNEGLSAIYTFFNPELASRSLGSYAILWQINEAKARGLRYLYLGYWIKECEKMRYKIDYRPTQLLLDNHWLTLR